MSFSVSVGRQSDHTRVPGQAQVVKLYLMCYNTSPAISDPTYTATQSWDIDDFFSPEFAEEVITILFEDSPFPELFRYEFVNVALSWARSLYEVPHVSIVRVIFEVQPSTGDGDDDDVYWEYHDNSTTLKDLVEFGIEKYSWCKKDDGKNDDQCVVCLEEYKMEENAEVGCMPCGHIFHSNCIARWLNIRRCCPLCRYEVQLACDVDV